MCSQCNWVWITLNSPGESYNFLGMKSHAILKIENYGIG